MAQLTHSPAPWHFHDTLLRSARGDILIFEEGTADGRLAQAAPDLLALLEKVAPPSFMYENGLTFDDWDDARALIRKIKGE